MTRFTYTIDDNNNLSIFDSTCVLPDNAPNIWQPHNENGAPFATKEEASAWAEETIANLLNPPKPDPKTVIIQGEVAADPVK